MKYYPVCLQIKERCCLVVGGGRVAERKAKGLLDCGASVTVISPELTDGLRGLHDDELISWQARGYRRDDVVGAFLVMAATDDSVVQDMVVADANVHNILLNVADVPEKCNFILPALVKRRDLTIAISTAGHSPALAKKLKQYFAQQIGSEFAVLNDIMGLLRPQVLGRCLAQEENEASFMKLLSDDMPGWIKEGDWPQVKRHIESVVGTLPEIMESQLQKLVCL